MSSRDRDAAQEELAIIIGTLGEAKSINPFTSSDSEGNWRCMQLYDELVRIDPETFEVIPGLAKDWTVKDLVITITLNDVKFSDGTDLTAEDIKFNLEGLVDPKVPSANYSLYASIKGYDAFRDGSAKELSGVTVVDPKTLTIELAKPDSSLIFNLRNVRPVPKAKLEGKDLATDAFWQKPIGAGPFVFESWSNGADFVMTKNPNYFEKDKPAISKVTHRVIADAQSIVLALMNGEIDGSDFPPPDAKEKLEGNDQLTVMVPPFQAPNGWMFNTKHELLAKKEVRQAIVMGLDREAYAEQALMGIGKAGIGPIAPGSWAFDKTLEPLPYDPDKAKQMIKDAGAEGAELRFEVNQGNTMREDWLAYTQQALEEIGIKVNAVTTEWATLVSAITDRKEFEVVGGDWCGVTEDPSGLLDQFHSKGAANYSGYANPDLDALLEKARGTLDQEEAKPIFADIQKILVEDTPFFFAWYRPFLHTINNTWANYTDSGGESLFYTLRDWTAASA